MMSQINIFVTLAILLFGTWVVFFAFQTSRTFRHPYLKWFSYYCLAKLFFVTHTFFLRYIIVNVDPNAISNIDRTLENINDVVFSLVAFASIVLLFRVVLGLGGRDFPTPVRRLILGVGASIVVGYGARILAPWGERMFGWYDVVARYVTIRITYYEIVPAAVALVLGYRRADGENAVLLKGFGWVFLFRLVLLWSSYPLWHSSLTQGVWRVVLTATILLLNTAVPLVWLRGVFIPCASREAPLFEDPAVLEAVAQRYKISKRECEIIRLILDGKSNKEMQDSLVVSIHTVKNHVYNIYKKLGVNNRYSLIHFITRYRDN